MGLYDNIRILEHKDTLEAIRDGKGLDCGPIHARIEPTEVCNFKCSFCYWHDDKRRETLPFFDFTGKRRLNLERLLRLVDELAEMGTKAISFTGAGEPLLFPSMDQVLMRIHAKGLYFGITSNMAMPMSDALIDALARAKWVRWSMNAGTMEIYVGVNNPREADGSKVFDRVQENVRGLNKARKQQKQPTAFNASYVVYESNRHDILPAARLAKALGADSISFRPDTPFERQMSPNKYDEEVAEDIQKARDTFETEHFRVYVNEDRSEDVQKLGDPELVCFYSNHTTYIAANGDVYPCCYTRHDAGYAMGNILEQSFKEFWFSEQRKQNYKKLVFDTCPSCPYGGTNEALQALYQGAKKASEINISVKEKDFFV